MSRKKKALGTRHLAIGKSNEAATGSEPSAECQVPSAIPPPAGPPAPGLECRGCGCRHFETIYTRPWAPGKIIRRRECRHCGTRMTTVEQEREEAQ